VQIRIDDRDDDDDDSNNDNNILKADTEFTVL
jgi:hypothetical protein